MSALAEDLFDTLEELNSLESLRDFALGGGTNLALAHGHRRSIDSDLFAGNNVGKKGFDPIEKVIQPYFGSKLRDLSYPCEEREQYTFCRLLVLKKNETIKVDIMHNFKMMRPTEQRNGIRTVSEFDVGILKLLSVSDRASQKDVYDLNLITDSIPLPELFAGLKERGVNYSRPEDRNIFDLDKRENPIQDPLSLLKFDRHKVSARQCGRPFLSNDILDILNGNIGFVEARIQWKLKIRGLFRQLGIQYPALAKDYGNPQGKSEEVPKSDIVEAAAKFHMENDYPGKIPDITAHGERNPLVSAFQKETGFKLAVKDFRTVSSKVEEKLGRNRGMPH